MLYSNDPAEQNCRQVPQIRASVTGLLRILPHIAHLSAPAFKATSTPSRGNLKTHNYFFISHTATENDMRMHKCENSRFVLFVTRKTGKYPPHIGK